MFIVRDWCYIFEVFSLIYKSSFITIDANEPLKVRATTIILNCTARELSKQIQLINYLFSIDCFIDECVLKV